MQAKSDLPQKPDNGMLPEIIELLKGEGGDGQP